MNKAAVLDRIGRVPVLGCALRRCARLYPEGSVVKIRNGHLAGCRWKRSHRYVSSYWLGTYELAVQDCLVRELRPGEVFYDIGANAGMFSLLASRCVGDCGRVFSFEPLPENVEMMRAQLGLNGVDHCDVVAMAVSDCTGEIELCEGRDTSTAHVKSAGGNAVRTRGGRATTLDEFIKTHPRPDLVKMDVEGAEIRVLRGAAALLSTAPRPRWLIEFHSDELTQEGRGLLEAAGYHLTTLAEPGQGVSRPHHVWAVPQEPARPGS